MTIRQEQVKFWRDLHLDNLELLRATYTTHTFAPHAHEGFALGVVRRGATTTSYRHEQYDMPAGAIIAINPGELHTGQAAAAQGWTYRMFYPKAALLQQIASELADRPRDVPFFPGPVIYDDALAGLLYQLHLILEDTTRPIIERQTLFWWTMAQLILRHADNDPAACPLLPEPDAVQTVRNYIETHYADDLSLPQLAALVNLTPCYMLRLFAQSVGLPPHAYLNNVRLQRAKQLLARGFSIVDTACQTGFTDQSHLTNRFKRAFGITPGQYLLSLN